MSIDAGAAPEPMDRTAWIDSNWQSDLVRPLLIALLSACLAAGPLAIAAVIWPDLPREAMLPLCFLAALIGVYSTLWLGRPGQRLVGRFYFRLGEVVLLLVLLRLATWLITGDWPGLADLRQWILSPSTFFDGVFVATALLALLAWSRSTDIAGIFEQLALTPAEVAWRLDRERGARYEGFSVEPVRISRQALADRFASQWLIGGGLLIFCAGLTRLRVGGGWGLRLAELGVPPQLIAAIVAYFLIGLVLLSQARLAMLRAQWLFEGVENIGGLPTRWQRLSLLLVLGVGLLATLLPLGSTWQAGRILGIVVSVLGQIVYAVFYLIFMLFVAVMSLFGMAAPGEDQLPPPMTPPPVEPLPPAQSASLPPWLGGVSFWIVAIAIVVGAAVFVLGKRGIALNRETLRRGWQALWRRLRNWWFGLRHLARSIQIGRPGADKGEGKAGGVPPWRFVRLGGLPPREKVRYFYLSTVRRAAEQGVVRRPSQTPLEFAESLERAWPDAELDVDALTGAFVTARYDLVDITEPEAKDVQTIWQRVKRALRGKRRQGVA